VDDVFAARTTKKRRCDRAPVPDRARNDDLAPVPKLLRHVVRELVVFRIDDRGLAAFRDDVGGAAEIFVEYLPEEPWP
jgi:hypothetical protein